jgi:plasmid replication initiation protein
MQHNSGRSEKFPGLMAGLRFVKGERWLLFWRGQTRAVTGGIERFLFRLVGKHAGNQRAGWARGNGPVKRTATLQWLVKRD